MGNQVKCNVCKCGVCPTCKGCSNCNPIRNCNTCLQSTFKNLEIKIGYQDLKEIYNNGVITSIQARSSCISSSNILLNFSKENIHHLLLYMEIQYGTATKKFAIQGTRNHGYMKISINHGQGCIHQFKKITGIDKPFKDLYNYAWRKQHNKQYHRYTNNCYHLGIKFIKFLKPNVESSILQEIHTQKDRQVQKYWD